ncbi:hypothetical protein ILUMI_23530, partial [Ignelater luminosus]
MNGVVNRLAKTGVPCHQHTKAPDVSKITPRNEYAESSSYDDSLKDPHFIPCNNQDSDSAMDESIIEMQTQTTENKSEKRNSNKKKVKNTLQDLEQLFAKYYELVDKGLQTEYNSKMYRNANCAIDTVLRKRDGYGFISIKQRGKHKNRMNKVDNALTQGVIDHINSFPKTESHYYRSTSTRQYLEGSLNVSIMYRPYIDKCREHTHAVKFFSLEQVQQSADTNSCYYTLMR